MRISRKDAVIASHEAYEIAEGRKWYPGESMQALREMGWLAPNSYPNNVFDLERRKGSPLNRNQILAALAMVVAIGEAPD